MKCLIHKYYFWRPVGKFLSERERLKMNGSKALFHRTWKIIVMHDTSEFTFTKFWFVSCYSLYTILKARKTSQCWKRKV